MTFASSLSERRLASGYRPRTLFRRPLARPIQVSTVARTVVDSGPSTTLPSPCASPQTSPEAANTGGSTRPQTRQQTAAVRRTATRWGTVPWARKTQAIGRYASRAPRSAPTTVPTLANHATDVNAIENSAE